MTFATLACAAPSSADTQQIAQLLDQLGVRAVLEQTPLVLTAAADAEAQFLDSKPQPANWRRDLETQLKPQLLLQNVTRYLHEHYRADSFRQAQQRLQEPLAKRARYFDLAMTQPGAERNLREFLRQNGLDRKSAAPAGSDPRRAVLSDIEAASKTSLLMATLQSAIAARVSLAAGGGAIDGALLNDAVAERQRYLAPLATDYLLYDYRYLRDDELRDYRELLRDEAVQGLLDRCRQALLTAIVGELTPPTQPPNPPQ